MSRTIYRALHRMYRIAARDTREAAAQAQTELAVFGKTTVLIEPFKGPQGQFIKASVVTPRSLP